MDRPPVGPWRGYNEGVRVRGWNSTMKAILARTVLFTGVCIFPAVAGNQILLRNLSSADGAPKILLAGGS